MSNWNKETAEWYAEKYGEYATNRLGVDELYLFDGVVVVDIGCGTGAALRHAASKIANGIFIGIDPVPRMVEIANERTQDNEARERIEYRVGSAEELPVNDHVADYVLAFDSIDHWQDVAQGLREVQRVIKSSGKFVLVKDQGVFGADKATETLKEELKAAGFVITTTKQISKDDVEFYWVISTLAK
jgi:ubiquinone/menaquinone biosynthesis C-methylase UbiE